MPTINFCFQSTDETVLNYLKGGEISKVKRWQQSSEYTFEFHFGHDTGRPIYVRPNGNTDTSNLPKIDTKNKYAYHYKSILHLTNGQKLNKELSNKAKDDILEIIQKQWTEFSKLAKRFWEGEPVRDTKTALELWAEDEMVLPEPNTVEISLNQLRKILGAT